MRTILNTSGAMTAAVVTLVVLTGCSAGAGRAAFRPGDRVRVVAAESFWGSIAAQLAGADGNVTSIISNPNADPHAYEPTPHDARAIASAQIVIENGIGYDSWVQRLVHANGASGQTVVNVGRIVGVPDGGNPHQWYSRAAVAQFVSTITHDLEAVDPAHRAGYEGRRHTFESGALAEYDGLIARIKRQYAGTPIGASESIVAPLAATLGLKIVTPASFLDAIAEGNEPTAADKDAVDRQIRGRAIKVLVFNRQNSTPDVQRLVDEAHAEHIPVATVTETLTPSTATFQDWQARELRDLLAALNRKGTA